MPKNKNPCFGGNSINNFDELFLGNHYRSTLNLSDLCMSE